LKDAEIPFYKFYNYYNCALQWGRVLKDAEITLAVLSDRTEIRFNGAAS